MKVCSQIHCPALAWHLTFGATFGFGAAHWICFSQTRMWMSPLFPRLPKGSSPSAGESPTFFKRDLLEYLASYRAPELEEWIQRIREYDLSETRWVASDMLFRTTETAALSLRLRSCSVVRVYLVGSTPGRYVGPDMERWGHLRLRKVSPSGLFFCQLKMTSFFDTHWTFSPPVYSAAEKHWVHIQLLQIKRRCYLVCKPVCFGNDNEINVYFMCWRAVPLTVTRVSCRDLYDSFHFIFILFSKFWRRCRF